MTLAQLRTLLPVPLRSAALHAPETLLDRDGGLALALLERRDAVRRRRVAGDAHDAAHGHGLVVGILSLAGEHGHWCWGIALLLVRMLRNESVSVGRAA